MMLEWPMYVDSAFALTPAAIIKEANVWWHACRPIGAIGSSSALARVAFNCNSARLGG